MSKRTKLIISIFVVLFLIISLNVGIIIYIKSSLKPTKAFLRNEVCSSGTGCEVTPFVVEEGSYVSETLDKLEAEGIIKNADVTYYWNKILGGYEFYAGYFEIPHRIEDENGLHDITLSEILAFLCDIDNAHQDTVMLKFNEGDFARSFAEKLATYCSLKEMPTDDVDLKKQTLLDYWNNEEIIRSYMEEYPFLTEDIFTDDAKVYLEGYLFPDTYEFYEYTSCDEITRKFLDQTLLIYESYENEFEDSDLSIHEIFTLASICQWESGSYVDSKNIAGVFLNRIENPDFQGTGGRLQSTVTACYAFDLTFSECYDVGDTFEYTEKDHPYNTYTIEGLPPGPVCNPSKVAILAALEPESNNYYFFCANTCDGGTAFATTYAAHEYNVQTKFVACAE